MYLSAPDSNKIATNEIAQLKLLLRSAGYTSISIATTSGARSLCFVSQQHRCLLDTRTADRTQDLALHTRIRRSKPVVCFCEPAAFPARCGTAPVWPGAVIVIPAGITDEIAQEAVEMTAFEDFVTEQVLAGRSIIGLYPATEPQVQRDFATWRQENKR